MKTVLQYTLLLVFAFNSLSTKAQCIESQNIKIETRKSCTSNNNGIVTLSGLYPKTSYTISLDNTNYNYTSNEVGQLNVYSLKPSTYRTLGIFDRINPCPTITIKESITIEAYQNIIEGPKMICENQELKLSSTHPSVWRVNSRTLNVNSLDLSYTPNQESNVEVMISTNIEGCVEKDTVNIQINRAPSIALHNPSKEYCYNKIHAGVRLNISDNNNTFATLNNTKYTPNNNDLIFVDIGNQHDENILHIESTNQSGCKTETAFNLNINGEAPADNVEILWWPGNIFSAKYNADDLKFQWGWIDSEGNSTFVDNTKQSPDGKFYFAGISNSDVNQIISHSNQGGPILFVEYKDNINGCSNRLLFNEKYAPDAYYRFKNYKEEVLMIKSFPNPFTEKLTIVVSEEIKTQELTLSIADPTGKIILSKNIDVNNGYYKEIETDGFPRGIYTASLHNSYYNLASQKLIKI